MVKVAIIGARGYTGIEAIEILLCHPKAKLAYLTATVKTVEHVTVTFPQLAGKLDMMIEPLDLDVLSKKADVALCCLPHKVSMEFVPKLLAAGVKVVDLSADYRIKDIAVYEKFYHTHTDPDNVVKAAFGLPELFRESIKGVDLVANPGCYPTSASLAVAPLLKAGLIETTGIIVNSVSGASGAGKNPSQLMHYPNMNENLIPYGIGTHRHGPEIAQIMSDVAGEKVDVLFQPHVGAFDRGILSTVYSNPKKKITQDEIIELYNEFYKDEPFVQVVKSAPSVKQVAKSNFCHVYPAVAGGKVICFSVIDNLIKGASGQAIQNMNIICGLDETMGLK